MHSPRTRSRHTPEAMRATVAIKDGDRVMAITEHAEHEFACGALLGIDRSDELIQIQIFWAPGKLVDAKLAMYTRIVERLSDNPRVQPQDVLISVIETAAENWSFGNGEAQFYEAPSSAVTRGKSPLRAGCETGAEGAVAAVRRLVVSHLGSPDFLHSRRMKRKLST
jgi:4-oxalocrotonate tautomerase